MKKHGFVYEFKKNKALFFMVAPTVLLVLVMSYLPMSGLVLAFKNYRFDRGVFGSEWIGKLPVPVPIRRRLADHPQHDFVQSSEPDHIPRFGNCCGRDHFRAHRQDFQKDYPVGYLPALLHFLGYRRHLCVQHL